MITAIDRFQAVGVLATVRGTFWWNHVDTTRRVHRCDHRRRRRVLLADRGRLVPGASAQAEAGRRDRPPRYRGRSPTRPSTPVAPSPKGPLIRCASL